MGAHTQAQASQGCSVTAGTVMVQLTRTCRLEVSTARDAGAVNPCDAAGGRIANRVVGGGAGQLVRAPARNRNADLCSGGGCEARGLPILSLLLHVQASEDAIVHCVI
jgi:hypothetical protein